MEAIRANHSQRTDASSVAPMNGTCGPRWLTPFGFYDHDASCWKTSQTTLGSDSHEPLATCPPWGMTQDGALYELRTPGLLTREPDCLLLPTPSANDNTGGFHEHIRGGGPGLRAIAVILRSGVPTNRQSKDGKPSPESPLPNQLTLGDG